MASTPGVTVKAVASPLIYELKTVGNRGEEAELEQNIRSGLVFGVKLTELVIVK